MIPLVVICLLFVLPLVLTVLLRINVIFVYVSVAAGNLLVNFLGDDALLSLLGFSDWRYISSAVQLFLLLMPLGFTLLFLSKTLSSSRLIVQLLPLALTCAMLFMLALPALPSDVVRGIYDVPYGDVIRKSQDVVIATASIAVLLTMWQGFRIKGHKKSEKNH